MKMDFTNEEIPLTPKGKGVRILGKRFQDWLVTRINSNRIVRVIMQSNGASVDADIKRTAKGTVVTLPESILSGGGGSLELTDGVTDLADVTKLTVTGGTVGGTPDDATLVITGGSAVTQFKIVSDGGDYWNCKTWDGTTLGSTEIKVAKPFKLRCGTGAIGSETIRGQLQNYAYALNGSSYIRTVTDSGGGIIERDVILPDALENDILYALSGFATDAPASISDVEYLDLNVDGRTWAEI